MILVSSVITRLHPLGNLCLTIVVTLVLFQLDFLLTIIGVVGGEQFVPFLNKRLQEKVLARI